MATKAPAPENNQRKSKISKRGGARPNAGRKAGTANVKTREIANRAAAEGITPLEVMLQAMRDVYGGSSGKERNAAAAFGLAKDAAPYMHAKIAAVELSGPDGGDLVIQVVRFADDQASQ